MAASTVQYKFFNHQLLMKTPSAPLQQRLRQSTRVSFMGWLYTPTLFSGLNAWIVVFDVEHEEYLESGIVRGDHTHLACL